MKMGVPILGTAAEDVDAAEDRELFDEILEQCQIPRAKGQTVFTAEEAKKAANELGYPVLVRPSYVLGGQGMQIAICDEDIDEFIGIINRIAQEHPILVDKYIMGKEIEVDAICDGTDILIPGIMEHIERTGIHSGDSISVYPAKSITEDNKKTIVEYTEKLARALHVKGMINIQFIVNDEGVFIIEVNPRSSRTVPYISKVTGIPIVPLATQIICGHTIRELGYTPGLQKEADYYAVKMPVFSFEKIRGADISLGPEMKSTGECLGIAKTFNLLGERSEQLTENFARSRKVSIEFEESQAPWMRALYLVCGLGSVLIIPLSLWLYGRGQLSITFLLGVLLFVFDLFGPIKALYSQATRLTVMNACMDRIEAVLAQPELPDRGRETLSKAGGAPEVEFRNVTFAYGEKEVLHDVSFTLEKNRMLALVGPSGGGKSTVANLLSRFWDVKQGQILVRGSDIRDIPLSDLMNQISMVFQRVYLFQDTVYNNIAMGRTDATREEVYEAARKARCYDFIMELPDGFDTVIGEGGASLSGGERQRISIARCILKDAPIVILDEATASVDADNESYIQEAITQLCQGKTLLVIAHRLNTIRHADEILVIDQGRIVQAGDHDKLMAEEGIYRRFITARSNPPGWCR